MFGREKRSLSPAVIVSSFQVPPIPVFGYSAQSEGKATEKRLEIRFRRRIKQRSLSAACPSLSLLALILTSLTQRKKRRQSKFQASCTITQKQKLIPGTKREARVRSMSYKHPLCRPEEEMDDDAKCHIDSRSSTLDTPQPRHHSSRQRQGDQIPVSEEEEDVSSGTGGTHGVSQMQGTAASSHLSMIGVTLRHIAISFHYRQSLKRRIP